MNLIKIALIFCHLIFAYSSQASETLVIKAGKSIVIPTRRFVGVMSQNTQIARVQERVLKGGYELYALRAGKTSLKLAFADGRPPTEVEVVVEKVERRKKKAGALRQADANSNAEKSRKLRELKRGPLVVPGWN